MGIEINNKKLSITDKQLVLIDICGRLPYGVIVQIPELFYSTKTIDVELDAIFKVNDDFHFTDDYGYLLENIKPYLRPMSSMTEEEIIELYKAFGFYYLTTNYEITDEWKNFKNAINNNKLFLPYPIWGDDVENGIKWLNRKMFDYRTAPDENGNEKTMIELGLALPTKEGMYKTE